MYELCRVVVVAALATSAVSAQTARAVVPPGYADKEGNALDHRPFAFDRQRLTQILHRALVNIPFGRMITEVGYRRDKTAFANQTMQRILPRRSKIKPRWAVRLANVDLKDPGTRTRPPGVAYDPENPWGRFPEPGDGTKNTAVELYNALTDFPDLPPVVKTVAPFLIRFKLVRPFVYVGPDGLMIDHSSFSTPAYTYNYFADAARPELDAGTARPFGVNCPSPENRHWVIPSNPGGEDMDLLLFGGPPSSSGLLCLSSSRTRWGPISLPLDLTPLGLPGCQLAVSLDVLVATPTLSTGAASVRISIPEDPGLAGLQFFSQYILLDARVNPSFPLAFSNGSENTIGRSIGKLGLRASLVYSRSPTTRLGLVDKGISLITEIVWR